jgi:hypothetical protein
MHGFMNGALGSNFLFGRIRVLCSLGEPFLVKKSISEAYNTTPPESREQLLIDCFQIVLEKGFPFLVMDITKGLNVTGANHSSHVTAVSNQLRTHGYPRMAAALIDRCESSSASCTLHLPS